QAGRRFRPVPEERTSAGAGRSAISGDADLAGLGRLRRGAVDRSRARAGRLLRPGADPGRQLLRQELGHRGR
ncbi:hypothetical protein LTR94_038465, partial [Friedmanniomyces endolithicus]